MDKFIVSIISVNEKQGVITWYGVFATHNTKEVCRCKSISDAQYICKLLKEEAKRIE